MTSLVMGLPLDLQFRTKGQPATDICADCYADGLEFDFACGDEVYDGCTRLRELFEASGQAYVLRAASSFMITLARGTRVHVLRDDAPRRGHQPHQGRLPPARGRLGAADLL